MTQTDNVQKVNELLKKARIAMLTTVNTDGQLVSRPMAVQEVEFDGDLWFFSDKESHKIDELASDGRANVSFGSGSSWVSVTGTASAVDDTEKAKQLWNAGAEAWFPDGPGTPGLVLIKVEAHTAEYWDTPGGRIASVISFAKAKVTGERYDGGENEVVDLKTN